MNVTFLSLIFFGLLMASSCAAEKPNIVVIFVDDLGYADLSLHGSPDVRTPNIDSIAKNGVRCLQGYVTAPMCAPSRAGIITGRYQQRFGFEFNMGPQLTMTVGLDREQKTIADLLKPAGYKSMVVGKWDLGASAPYRPLKRGFDEFYGFHGGSRPHMPHGQDKYPPNVMFEGEKPVKETGWSSDIYGAKAADFIRRHKSGPFFLYTPFTAPHWPMEAKPEDIAKYENVEDLHRRTFLGMMEGLDRGVGMILDAIRDAGVEKNTLIFFASDNGGATGPERTAPDEPFHQGVNTSRNEPFRGWIDVEGRAYDFGFTFVNLEAIHYGLASPAQARSILDWLDGKREIAADTSRGADIYHWRFAPRATTRRNIDTYVWPWSNPEQIPWGGQIQDGGAVLGFSFHDLMARLKTNGPDDAWKRLREILAWFREVQSEGGYRAYYAKPGRGTLQGGGPAGGLGMDQEFLESVLVPQVVLHGFLGFQATADGYELHPRLPKDWPSLTISGIRFHDRVLTITAHADGKVEVCPK